MRAYFFGNMYLSSIQQGIQAAHVVHDMFVTYQVESERKQKLFNWATNHKTMILLNAGYSSEIFALSAFFRTEDNPYPWSNFYEDPDALNSAITSVGIILPAKIYDRKNWRVKDIDISCYVQTPERVELPTSTDLTGYPFQISHFDPVTGTESTLDAYDMVLAGRIAQYGLAK